MRRLLREGRNRLLRSAAALPVLAVGPALGADLPVKAPPMPAVAATPYNWTGFYGGLNAGGYWAYSGDPTTTASCTGFAFSYFECPAGAAAVSAAGTGSLSGGGFLGGGQIGANWQTGAVVLGVETDFDYLNLKASRQAGGIVSTFFGSGPFTISNSVSANGLYTLRGRVGWAFNNLLPYVTGGWALTSLSASNSYSDTIGPVTASWNTPNTLKGGWVVGGGLEWAFSHNWTAKVEYLYVNFGPVYAQGVISLSGGGGYANAISTSTDLTLQIVRAGVNYKF